MAIQQPTSGGASVTLGGRALAARRVGRARGASWWMAALFMAPALVVYLYFMVNPFLSSIYLSLTDWDGYSPVINFVGLDNYVSLFNDPEAWHAFTNNLIWAVVGTAGPILLALPLSISLWSGVRFRTVFRTIYFLPFILPLVVIGIVWGWIFHPLDSPIAPLLGWLGDERLALIAVLITAIWSYFGFVVVVLLAGLQNVNIDLVDASKVDGANSFQRARHVILPQIAPVLTTVTTITLMGAFSVFDIVFVMTRGGPGTATQVLGTYTYEAAFNRSQFGYGAAAAIVIAAMSLVLGMLFVRLRERSQDV